MTNTSIPIGNKLFNTRLASVNISDIALWADNPRVKYDIENDGINTKKIKHDVLLKWMFEQTSVSEDNCGPSSLLTRINEGGGAQLPIILLLSNKQPEQAKNIFEKKYFVLDGNSRVTSYHILSNSELAQQLFANEGSLNKYKADDTDKFLKITAQIIEDPLDDNDIMTYLKEIHDGDLGGTTDWTVFNRMMFYATHFNKHKESGGKVKDLKFANEKSIRKASLLARTGNLMTERAKKDKRRVNKSHASAYLQLTSLRETSNLVFSAKSGIGQGLLDKVDNNKITGRQIVDVIKKKKIHKDPVVLKKLGELKSYSLEDAVSEVSKNILITNTLRDNINKYSKFFTGTSRSKRSADMKNICDAYLRGEILPEKFQQMITQIETTVDGLNLLKTQAEKAKAKKKANSKITHISKNR